MNKQPELKSNAEPKQRRQWWTDSLSVKLHPVIALLVLSGLLQACATRSPASIPVQPPAMPKPPASLMKPVSPESYSERAQKNTSTWQQKLTASETK